MTAPDFEDFCQQLCSTFGVPPPALAWNGSVPPAFSLSVHGVDIAFVQAPCEDGDQAVMLVDFGELPQDGAHDALRVLLEANFLVLGPQSPAFGINPASGHVVYHLGFVPARADVPQLASHLAELAGSVLRWRSDARQLPPLQADPVRGLVPVGHFA